MGEETSKPIPASRVRFIRDVPAEEDFFFSHTRIAQAIAEAIEFNPDLKVIGLLGRWGSGKSTVSKTLRALLENRKDKRFRVFIYDAWLHQSDPLRRSFLESLISYLVEDHALDKDSWNSQLDKLSSPVEDTKTIETPSLSVDARLIGLALFAVPVGVSLLGIETIKEAYGNQSSDLGLTTFRWAIFLIILPALVWLAIYIWRRPWKRIIDRDAGLLCPAFWQMLDEDGQPTSAFHLFEDGRPKHTSTRTFRSIEPTSLEFGRMFREIMREAANGAHRLIILIDNLDRVAEAEALQMWATIRSFFLASDETEDIQKETFHPTVILPIDGHAIEELFAHTGDDRSRDRGRDRARSFMDKTFDVTFEVTEPVNSDWRAFLDQQMSWMFGSSYQSQWGFWTRRLFASELLRHQTNKATEAEGTPPIVTPREINKLLNRIGALYLQWADEGIPVEVMALYVIRHDDIDRGILPFLQLNTIEIEPVAPDWKRQIAAIYFGVEVDKAAQVLLEEPIRLALLSGDATDFDKTSSIPGFGEIFEYATASLPDPDDGTRKSDVLRNAVVILDSLNGDREDWLISSWRNLQSAYVAIGAPEIISANDLVTITLLSNHLTPDGYDPFFETSAAIISTLLSIPGIISDEARLETVAEDLIGLAQQKGHEEPIFELSLSPQDFVKRVSQFADSPRVWRQLRTPSDGSELGQAISEMLGNSEQQAFVPGAVHCLSRNAGALLYSSANKIDFESVAARADQIARNSEPIEISVSAIRVLAELSYSRSEGRARILALVDEGVLAAKLKAAAAIGDNLAVADLLAISIWRGKRFELPNDFRHSDYDGRHIEYTQRLLASINKYYPASLVPILWGSYRANYGPSQGLIEKLIGYVVANDALGSFDVNAVVDDLWRYKLAVPSRLRDKFLEIVGRKSDLFDVLEEAPLGPPITAAAEYLRKRGGESADRADSIVKQRVEEADEELWSAAIRTGSEPYKMGSGLVDGGLRLNRRSGLYDALNASIPSLAKDGGREMRARWFKLTELLSARPRNAVMEALATTMNSASPDHMLHVLKAGGVRFLKCGGFAARPDQSVRMIILRLLQTKDGRAWLKDNDHELAAWIQRVDSSTMKDLESSLRKLHDSSVEERRYAADVLANRWSIVL